MLVNNLELWIVLIHRFVGVFDYSIHNVSRGIFTIFFKFVQVPYNWCAIFVVRTINLGVSVFCKLFFSPLIWYIIGSQ